MNGSVPEPKAPVRGPALLLRYWLPVLAYVVLIFSLSSIQGSRLPNTFPYADKIAHLLEYSLFGLLVGRAIRFTLVGLGAALVTLAAVLIGAAVGFADEMYQGHVPGRQRDPTDWLTDVAAVAIAVVLARVISVGRQGGTVREQSPEQGI